MLLCEGGSREFEMTGLAGELLLLMPQSSHVLVCGLLAIKPSITVLIVALKNWRPVATIIHVLLCGFLAIEKPITCLTVVRLCPVIQGIHMLLCGSVTRECAVTSLTFHPVHFEDFWQGTKDVSRGAVKFAV
jgi:hypothetical protein